MGFTTQFRKCESSLNSFASFATVNLIDFRNGGVEPHKADEPQSGESWKKITAEIGFALTLLVGLVEFVVRAILSIIAFPIIHIMNCLNCGDAAGVSVVQPTIGGAIVTGETVAKLAVLLFANCSEERIAYEQLPPDTSDYNTNTVEPCLNFLFCKA